jgi:hypothetical protein
LRAPHAGRGNLFVPYIGKNLAIPPNKLLQLPHADQMGLDNRIVHEKPYLIKDVVFDFFWAMGEKRAKR